MMDEESREREVGEEVNYASVVFNSNISALKGEENASQREADTEYDEVKVRSDGLEQMTPAGGNDPKYTCRMSLCSGVLCVILASVLIGLSSYVFIQHFELVSELRHSKANQSALLANNDRLLEVVGNLTLANETLVMIHSNLSRSCDISQSETRQLRTELEETTKELEETTKELEETTKELEETTKRLNCCHRGDSSGCRPCEDGWIHDGSSCYVIQHRVWGERNTWAQARDDCRRRKADLVVIDNEKEQNFVYTHSSRKFGYSSYWLGLSELDATESWSWVDGTQVTLRYWTRTNVTSSSPHCAITLKNGKPFGWRAVDCTAKNHWMCEKPVLSVEPTEVGSGE
ncbi:hypothetical protein CRUP_000921 [Coryphaenoides rupestris]|nr:hypothetical protein CRUP_000921 [Coryphaenoides rupestris]